MKKLLLALFAVLAMGSAFAQTKFPLYINCSEMGADVYINNKLYTKTVPNLKVQLPPAVYNIKIAKDGFQEFNTNVTVKASGTDNVLSVVLQPMQGSAPALIKPANTLIPSFLLRVICNVQGAQIFVDGALVGTTPNDAQIRLGQHEVRVTSPGFGDFVQAVDVKAAISLNANLIGTSQQLSISSNVNGATVLINGNQAGLTPFNAQVPNGSYSITVKAPGYLDFVQNVVVNGAPTQVNANLQGMNVQVSVTSNVNGALVFINGNQAGQTPFNAQLPNGSYSIAVKAPGYLDYVQNLVVSGTPVQLNALLQAQTYQLSVGANVNGALVFINGNQSGQTPFASMLTPGTYTIIVRAPGYVDYQAQIAVNGAQSVNVSLQPQMASWQLGLPQAIVNRDIKPGQPRGIQVWVDGAPQAEIAGPIAASGQLLPGHHTIRLASGGLSTELQIDAVAGKTYVLEPFLGINLK